MKAPKMADENNSVLYSVVGARADLILNRPDKRNALSDELIYDLKQRLHLAESDRAVRVVVVSGAGTDFCSGADLSALQKMSGASIAENAKDARSLMELFLVIRNLLLPVIAAVKGRALAGGCGLATACDIVLASSSARFGYPETKIGFVPAMVMAILRRNVSEKRAFELLTRGAEISAKEAEGIGLINQVFADDTFEAGVDEYARAFENVSASGVVLSKKLLYQMDGMTFIEALQAGADVNLIARMTDDCQKGIARFLKKE